MILKLGGAKKLPSLAHKWAQDFYWLARFHKLNISSLRESQTKAKNKLASRDSHGESLRALSVPA
jgi:hypothetical protein